MRLPSHVPHVPSLALRRCARLGFAPPSILPCQAIHHSSSLSTATVDISNPSRVPTTKRPFATSASPSSRAQPNHFFDSLRPASVSSSAAAFDAPSSFLSPLTSLRAPPPTQTHNEAKVFDKLAKLLSKPASERDAYVSGEIWRTYRILSPAFRRSLPIETLQCVFRSVLPNTHFVKNLVPSNETYSLKTVSRRADVHQALGEKWEYRLRTVASDLMAANPSQVDLRIFVPALRKLAFVGDRTGCEAITREIRHRYPIDGADSSSMSTSRTGKTVSPRLLRAMYNIGLKAVSHWLRLNALRWRHNQPAIAEAVETSKRLVLAIQEVGSTPSPLTAKALLGTARHISITSQDEEMIAAFDRLAEVILKDGYGIDLDGLVWDPEVVRGNEAVRLAIVHLLGRRGKLYRMIAAFDALYPADVRGIQDTAVKVPSRKVGTDGEEEEEVIPTLSAMLEAEKAERALQGWFGRKAQKVAEEGAVLRSEEPGASSFSTDPEIAQTPRNFDDFLSPIPSPSEIRALSSSTLSDMTDEQIARLVTPQDGPHSRRSGYSTSVPDESTIMAMLRQTWRNKSSHSRHNNAPKEVAVHALQLATRAAWAEQARFLSEVFAPQAQTEAKAEGTIVSPLLRIHPHWFTAAWRTVRVSNGHNQARSGMAWSDAILDSLHESLERVREEQEILAEAIAKLEPASAAPDAAVDVEIGEVGAVQIDPSTQVESVIEEYNQQLQEGEREELSQQALESLNPLLEPLHNQRTKLLQLQSSLEDIQTMISGQTLIVRDNKKRQREAAKLRKMEERERAFALLEAKRGRKSVREREKEREGLMIGSGNREEHVQQQEQGQEEARGQAVLA